MMDTPKTESVRYERLPDFHSGEVVRFTPSPGSRGGVKVSRRLWCFLLVACSTLTLSLVYWAVLPRSLATSLPWDAPAEVLTDTNSLLGAQQVPGTDICHVDIDLSASLDPAPARFQPLERLLYDTVNAFYNTGQINSSLPSLDPIDIIYLYVNSSSPIFNRAIHDRAERQGVSLTASLNHWRENGELKGAMRSALRHVENLGDVHLLTGVYPDHDDRLGHGRKLKWHTHAETFRLPVEAETLWSGREEEWRNGVMPSFSVFAIEGYFDRIKGLSDHVILSNDDMFFMNDLKSTDFHSPIYGSVIRLDKGIKLGIPSQSPPRPKSKASQWSGLESSNQLLSLRFPALTRNYQHHVPKTLSKAALDEAAVIWADEIAEGATRGFAGIDGGMDVDVPWLATWLGIERWREALLWVWVVGRMGQWGAAEREEVMRVLGARDGDSDVEVSIGERDTLVTVGEVLETAGWPEPLKTTYSFSSMDGHLDPLKHTTWHPPSCKLDINQCFGPNFLNHTSPISAEEVFKRIAFEKPECGNCLLYALVTASGRRGLGAILPAEGIYLDDALEPVRKGDEPILPMTKEWRSTDFSVRNVVRRGQDSWPDTKSTRERVNLRRWSIKLLTRYAYVIGDSPIRFSQLHTWQQTETVLAKTTDRDSQHLAMLCLNDDVSVHHAQQVKERIEAWSGGLWPERASWERL